MSLYSAPPPARSFHDDKATLLVCWWCTCFAAVIILFRVCGRYIRTEKLFREDWLAFACLIPLLTRMALVHVVLLFGTNNAVTTGLSQEDISRRTIGSRLVLGSRIFYAATLWMLKLTISEFFKRLTFTIWTRSHEIMLQFIRWFLLLTFLAVVIADLSECQPITHYWQVVPDPGGRCRQGYAQLLTMGTANVVSDILLVAFPIPIIIKSRMSVKRKIQLVVLFAGSLLPAGTTLYRIPNIISRDGSQQYRSLLASIEILFATAVANALILGSFVRDRGVKKQRWKHGSITGESIERTASRRGTVVRQWGSDEDLVRDLGMSVDPELRGDEEQVPRPAPMAVKGNMPVKLGKMGVSAQDWDFPLPSNNEARAKGSDSSSDLHLDLMKISTAGDHDHDHSPHVPRRVSFFDVGGLLEKDDELRRGSETRTTITDTEDGESSTTGRNRSSRDYYYHSNENGTAIAGGLSPAPPRRGSTALLQDIGGLLGGPRPQKKMERGYELQTILQEGAVNETSSPARGDISNSNVLPRRKETPTAFELRDVGGLLA